MNKEEADAQADAQARDNAAVEAFLQPRLERAERAFGQAMTSLWVGNAGAALATLSFIGATWKDNAFPTALLWPLVLFVLGVIFMGVGALITLIREKRSIERMQSASSVLDLNWGDIESPIESTGLTLRHWRTRMAIISGVCFVIGCLIGLFLLIMRAG